MYARSQEVGEQGAKRARAGRSRSVRRRCGSRSRPRSASAGGLFGCQQGQRGCWGLPVDWQGLLGLDKGSREGRHGGMGREKRGAGAAGAGGAHRRALKGGSALAGPCGRLFRAGACMMSMAAHAPPTHTPLPPSHTHTFSLAQSPLYTQSSSLRTTSTGPPCSPSHTLDCCAYI
jgi:hypothetical protein